MKLFSAAALKERRQKLAQKLSPVLRSGDLVLFLCGEPIQKPGGLDQTYPFLPHPEYFWLTGLRRPRGVVAFQKDVGWCDFANFPTDEEKLWEGGADEDSSSWGLDLKQLKPWLTQSQVQRLVVFGALSPSFFSLVKESVPFDAEVLAVGDPSAVVKTSEIQELVNESRRPKDVEEIQLIKQNALIAQAGYRRITEILRPGLSERELQIEYEAEIYRAGAQKVPYETIVGSGSNSAILHAIPTGKIIGDNEFVLVDAGSDVHDYCVDITRMYSSSGRFTSQQQDLYDVVLRAHKQAITMCQSGVEWREVHTCAARILADGLKSLRILTCSVDEAIDEEVISIFFPHGVGHMVGLKVRDVGGRAGRSPAICGGVRLRVDLPLEENFVMTVEPGLYFVKALLNRRETAERFKSQVNWTEVQKWMEIGGVRIEDDILVTKSGPENLTDIVPKIGSAQT